MQRYKFESKSQLMFPRLVKPLRCKRICKDTNLKANHNLKILLMSQFNVVSVYAKIQI